MNGFMLFARELQTRHRDQNLPSGKVELKTFIQEVASPAWAVTQPHIKEQYKDRVRALPPTIEGRINSRRNKTRGRGYRAAGWDNAPVLEAQDGDDAGPGDEIDILERLPRKRLRDLERLRQKWAWNYGKDNKEPHWDTPFLLISSVHFATRKASLTKDESAKFQYFPAEMAIASFSLRKGVLDLHTHVFPHLPLNEIDDDEGWEYGCQHEHGIEPLHGDNAKAENVQHMIALRDSLEKMRVSMRKEGGLLLCFEAEVLSVVGCLNYASADSPKLSGVEWEKDVVCVEDFLDASLRWHKPPGYETVVSADEDRLVVSVRSLRSTLSKLRGKELWNKYLCVPHTAARAPPEGVAVWECPNSAISAMVALLRDWVGPKKEGGLGRKTGFGVLAHGTERDRELPVPLAEDVGEDSRLTAFAKAAARETTAAYAALLPSRDQGPSPLPLQSPSQIQGPGMGKGKGRGRGRGMATAHSTHPLPGLQNQALPDQAPVPEDPTPVYPRLRHCPVPYSDQLSINTNSTRYSSLSPFKQENMEEPEPVEIGVEDAAAGALLDNQVSMEPEMVPTKMVNESSTEKQTSMVTEVPTEKELSMAKETSIDKATPTEKDTATENWEKTMTAEKVRGKEVMGKEAGLAKPAGFGRGHRVAALRQCQPGNLS